MPKTTINKATAPGPRKGAKNGKNKARAGRPGSTRTKEKAPAIIANSIFALTLKPRPVLSIDKSIEKKNAYHHDDDYDVMYQDIKACVQQAVLKRTGQRTTFDPLKNGFDISESIRIMLNIFELEVMPAGWKYNIEKDNKNRYHLVVYKECEFSTMWHAFQIENIVTVLNRTDLKLHNVFLKVIAHLIGLSDIPAWWGHALGYADIWTVEDHIENKDFDTAEERDEYVAEWEAEKEKYKSGVVNDYEQLIRKVKVTPTNRLRKELNQFSKRNPLVKWMLGACDFIDTGLNVRDFIYPEQCEEIEGLMFDMQMGIYWNMMDIKSKEQEEFLDAEANGCGIHIPVYNFRIYPDTKSIPFGKAKTALEWPIMLSNLYNEYCQIENTYERKNRKNKKKL